MGDHDFLPQQLVDNRLFFALWPDDATRRQIHAVAAELHARMQLGGYLIKPNRYHLTLAFLGNHVSKQHETAALRAAAEVRARAFSFNLSVAGSFANRQIPCWLGAATMPDALTDLHQRLGDSLLMQGVPTERMRFVPHLSIARNISQLLPHTPARTIPWRVREFVLIRSRLNQYPVQYQVLGRFPLPEDAVVPPRAGQLDLF